MKWLERLKRAKRMRIGRFGVPHKTARSLESLGLARIETVRRASGFGSDNYLCQIEGAS